MLWRLFAALALLSSPVFADEPQDGDDIVVVGERLREQVRSFVAEAAQEMSSEGQMARWERRMCPMLAGMRDRAQAQFVVDRIARRAYAVGIDSGGPSCRPNVLIFVTPDSQALAAAIAAQYRELIGYHANATAVTMGHEALTSFVETPRPVRWWHVSQTVTEDGHVLGDSLTQPTGDGLRNVQVVRTGGRAGRLERTTRQDFSRVIVIVDADDAAGVQMAQLGDYLAMSSLAQLAPDAELSGAPSILDLFDAADAGRPAPAEMTEWDIAYLEGLYRARRNAPTARAQRRDIARRMESELSE